MLTKATRAAQRGSRCDCSNERAPRQAMRQGATRCAWVVGGCGRRRIGRAGGGMYRAGCAWSVAADRKCVAGRAAHEGGQTKDFARALAPPQVDNAGSCGEPPRPRKWRAVGRLEWSTDWKDVGSLREVRSELSVYLPQYIQCMWCTLHFLQHTSIATATPYNTPPANHEAATSDFCRIRSGGRGGSMSFVQASAKKVCSARAWAQGEALPPTPFHPGRSD